MSIFKEASMDDLPLQILISWFPLILLPIFWLVPVIIISKSKIVGKREKMAWLFATLFISWGAWVLYVLLAPLKSNDN